MGEGSSSTGHGITRFFDLLGLIGILLAAPAAFLICGAGGPAAFLERSLGGLGSPASLLIACMALLLLRALFGSSRRALPVLAGLIAGLLAFAAAFDIPGLGPIRAGAARFPAFAEPGPAFFGGLGAIVLGSLLGQGEGRIGPWKLLAPLGLALALILGLAAWNPFPPLGKGTLSIEAALDGISAVLGYDYKDPEVERAVREVLEDKEKSEAEKEATIALLTERLKRAEEDRAALSKAAEDATRLGAELEASRRALEELKGRLDKDAPLLPGGSYAAAIQPMDPAVRDFAVAIAGKAPGAFDAPQGSRKPSAEGLRQAILVHGAIAGSWKYVSDPAGSWRDYVSPARRTLALGLAGDCDDFAVMTASAMAAIGGRVRVMHGYAGGSGHAWAELWLGSGAGAREAAATLAGLAGRPVSAIATGRDSEGGSWLVLDWRLGEYSMRADRLEVGWSAAP